MSTQTMKNITNQQLRFKSTQVFDTKNKITKNQNNVKLNKLLLVIRALKEFHKDIAFPYKSCLRFLAIASFFIACAILFPILIVRAIDIEADAHKQVIADHNAFLEIRLSNDAPQEKGVE